MSKFVDLDFSTDLPWLLLEEQPEGGHCVIAAFADSEHAALFCKAVQKSTGRPTKVVRAVSEER